MGRYRDNDRSFWRFIVLVIIFSIVSGFVIFFTFKLLWSKVSLLYNYLENIIKNKFNLGEITSSILALAISSMVFAVPLFIIILWFISFLSNIPTSSSSDASAIWLILKFLGMSCALSAMLYAFFAFILTGINMIIRKHKEYGASSNWGRAYADKGYGVGQPPKEFILIGGDEFNRFYNSVIQPIADSPFFYRLLRLSVLFIWMYYYLWVYFIKTIWLAFTGSLKQKVTIITENFGNDQRLVRVPDKYYYFVDSNANSGGYYKERGQYYFNSKEDYGNFLESYKFYRSNIFSISINNYTYKIYKRNDLGIYIIPNLPQGIDIKKYYLMEDKYGQLTMPISGENGHIIKNLISELINNNNKH